MPVLATKRNRTSTSRSSRKPRVLSRDERLSVEGDSQNGREVYRPEGVITNRAFTRCGMTKREVRLWKKMHTHLMHAGKGLKPWRVKNWDAPKLEAAPRPDNSQKVKVYVPQSYGQSSGYGNW